MNMPQSRRQTEACQQIRDWLQERSAMHYPAHKLEMLEQRLDRVRRDFKLSSLAELAQRVIVADVRELQLAVIHAASTNHTYLFREPEMLEEFCDILARGMADRSEIRIWSAACSSGDECFTFAIMCAEKFGFDFLKRLRILGTDISAQVIAQAESGVVPERHLEQTAPELRDRYFTRCGDGLYRIDDRIRAVCTFRRLNLKTRPLPFRRPFHGVLCRNVLYYFLPEDQADTLEAIAAVTEPGGWLLTSVTENARDASSSWIPVSNAIYKKGGPMR